MTVDTGLSIRKYIAFLTSSCVICIVILISIMVVQIAPKSKEKKTAELEEAIIRLSDDTASTTTRNPTIQTEPLTTPSPETTHIPTTENENENTEATRRTTHAQTAEQTTPEPTSVDPSATTPEEEEILECRMYENGTDYMGVLSTSTTPKTCQRWDSQSPHTHPFTDIRYFPDASFEELGNKCRNPDGAIGGLWCFVDSTQGAIWEYCDVVLCTEQQLIAAPSLFLTGYMPFDCKELYEAGRHEDNVYWITVGADNSGAVEAYCELSQQRNDGTTSGGWTVFQRRVDGDNRYLFHRGWDDYASGFGDRHRSYWLGLETLNRLTSDGNHHELHIDLERWDGTRLWAHYDNFGVGSALSHYRLTVSGYSGTAGDALTCDNGNAEPAQSSHTMPFSTPDSDHDRMADTHCASILAGGWWYNECIYVVVCSNLNGIYQQHNYPTMFGEGVVWYLQGDFSLKSVTMKVK